MNDITFDRLLLLVAIVAVLAAAAGWMIEKDRPALARNLRRSGYLGMLAAGVQEQAVKRPNALRFYHFQA